MSLLEQHQEDFVKAIEHFKSEIASLKTGRANPAILDQITVTAYNTKTPLNQVASISVPEARSIVVQPWDKTVLKEVEKALRESELDLSLVNEGDKIRITIPQMTEESRKQIVKNLNHKAEEARIAIRNIRDEIKDQIIQAEKNKEFGEDEKFSQMEALDKVTAKYNEQIKDLSQAKEQEIMTV